MTSETDSYASAHQVVVLFQFVLWIVYHTA